MILVDSSIWIHLWRFGAFRDELCRLQANRQIVTHAYLVAELALGSLRERKQTLEYLDNLPQLPTVSIEDVRLMIEARAMFSQGIGLIDAHLLASCLSTPGATIWTRDTRLGNVAEFLGIRADVQGMVN